MGESTYCWLMAVTGGMRAMNCLVNGTFIALFRLIHIKAEGWLLKVGKWNFVKLLIAGHIVWQVVGT